MTAATVRRLTRQVMRPYLLAVGAITARLDQLEARLRESGR
jgi:hypothetical protein